MPFNDNKISEQENIHLGLDFNKRPQPRHYTIARLIAEHAPKKGQVLDIGCGRGDILSILQQKRPDLNLSIADAYEICLKGTERRLGNVSGSYLIDEDKFNLNDVIHSRFDVVVMCHCLEHIKRPVDAINASLELLSENGMLIVAVPNLASPGRAFASTFGIHYVNKGHVCGWDGSHWRNLWLNIIGVTAITHYSDTADIFPGIIGRVIRRSVGPMIAKLIPGWSDSLIVVVKR